MFFHFLLLLFLKNMTQSQGRCTEELSEVKVKRDVKIAKQLTVAW